MRPIGHLPIVLALVAVGAVFAATSLSRADGSVMAASAAGGWDARSSERVPWAAVVDAAPVLPTWHGSESQRLALAVAKVAANEGGMLRAADVAVVWQTARSHGRTSLQRLRWLRGHSRRVLGTECEPKRHGNCAWTRHLRWGTRRPEGWPAQVSWRPLAWLRVLQLSLDLVEGRTHFEPCPVDPWTWGGRMDVRHAVAVGLVPIGCQGSLNDGFVPVARYLRVLALSIPARARHRSRGAPDAGLGSHAARAPCAACTRDSRPADAWRDHLACASSASACGKRSTPGVGADARGPRAEGARSGPAWGPS